MLLGLTMFIGVILLRALWRYDILVICLNSYVQISINCGRCKVIIMILVILVKCVVPVVGIPFLVPIMTNVNNTQALHIGSEVFCW